MDAVTEVLIDRSAEADKVVRVVGLSLLAHIVILGGIALAPGHREAPDTSHGIVITMGGPVGPVQGHNNMAAKHIQEVAPPTAKPQPEAPPALAKPEMVVPVKKAPTQREVAKPDVKKPEPQLHGRTPTTGAEVNNTTARIETHGSKFGTGLATGGGGGGDAYTELDNFCCPEYLTTIKQRITENWQRQQSQVGQNQVKFTIQRDGTITNIVIEKSGGPVLDLATERAVARTAKLPPLPAAFTPSQLTIHIPFEYIR